jgi:hypothetical protein
MLYERNISSAGATGLYGIIPAFAAGHPAPRIARMEHHEMTESSQASGFTPDELGLLRKAAVLAGAVVAISKYSGSSGTDQEFRAIIEGLEQEVQRYPANPLVAALLTQETRSEVQGLAPYHRDAPTQRAFDDFRLSAMNRCTDAGELLKKKAAPEQAAEVIAAIVAMCGYVANRSKEGTVFGFGGTRVDARESAMVDEVRRALSGE